MATERAITFDKLDSQRRHPREDGDPVTLLFALASEQPASFPDPKGGVHGCTPSAKGDSLRSFTDRAMGEGDARLRATGSRIDRTPAPQARAGLWPQAKGESENPLNPSGRGADLSRKAVSFGYFLTEGNPVGLLGQQRKVTRPRQRTEALAIAAYTKQQQKPSRLRRSPPLPNPLPHAGEGAVRQVFAG